MRLLQRSSPRIMTDCAAGRLQFGLGNCDTVSCNDRSSDARHAPRYRAVPARRRSRLARRTRADAGPPFLSNDPGTPGNANWEINIAATQTTQHGLSVWQLPQLDVNCGVGERIQLTAEIPYVVLNSSPQPQASGWGNANQGVKWRFFDQGENGWQISAFPMYQTGGSADAQRKGIAVEGPRIGAQCDRQFPRAGRVHGLSRHSDPAQ